MLTRHVALVSEIGEITPSELTQVAAALNQQATDHFGPLWGGRASVSAFHKLRDVPLDYWPVIIDKDIQEPGAAGVHLNRKSGQPFALVQYEPQWSLTASHETLEMLADPFGSRLVSGLSPADGLTPVRFLVEVCDPCESASLAYQIEGVTVSDFVTPQYYGPVGTSGAQYSFSGKITQPLEVLTGGYLSWQDPAQEEWFQLTRFDGPAVIRSLGKITRDGASLRELIDSVTPIRLHGESVEPMAGLSASHADRLSPIRLAREARAEHLRGEIQAVKNRSASVTTGAFTTADADGIKTITAHLVTQGPISGAVIRGNAPGVQFFGDPDAGSNIDQTATIRTGVTGKLYWAMDLDTQNPNIDWKLFLTEDGVADGPVPDAFGRTDGINGNAIPNGMKQF